MINNSQNIERNDFNDFFYKSKNGSLSQEQANALFLNVIRIQKPMLNNNLSITEEQIEYVASKPEVDADGVYNDFFDKNPNPFSLENFEDFSFEDWGPPQP